MSKKTKIGPYLVHSVVCRYRFVKQAIVNWFSTSTSNIPGLSKHMVLFIFVQVNILNLDFQNMLRLCHFLKLLAFDANFF